MDEAEIQLIREYEAAGWQTFDDEGFVPLAGPFFYRSAGNGLTLRFPTSNKHRNRNGVVQGGALMTFTDRSLGVAGREMSGAQRTTTVQLNINFIDVVRIGEVVELTPVMTRASKLLIFMSGTLMVGERVVAQATGIWKQILQAG